MLLALCDFTDDALVVRDLRWRVVEEVAARGHELAAVTTAVRK